MATAMLMLIISGLTLFLSRLLASPPDRNKRQVSYDDQLVINNFSVKRGSFTLSPILPYHPMGEIFAILGRTGSGKTVLLEPSAACFPVTPAASSLTEPTYGTYLPLRRKLGLVYQDYGLFPHMKVKENIPTD